MFQVLYCNSQACTAPGFSCRDCWTFRDCVPNGDGTFFEELIPCPTGTSCQNSVGSCRPSGNYECDDASQYLFKCYGPGVFPDPFNCNTYHTCIFNGGVLQDIKSTCPVGYYFNTFTGRCGIRLEDPKKCPSPVSICSNSGKSGSVDGNKGIYYLCTEGYIGTNFHYLPEIFACPFNHYFNGTQCLDPTPIVVDQQGKCVEAGLFQYPENCQMYRQCNATGSYPDLKTCTNTTQRFDAIERKCIEFDCPYYHV